jgi:hypothetical protein
MKRIASRCLVAASLLAACGGATTAHAQWGYGGMGWGGWGASTAAGDEAMGAGMFLMGAGQYNLNTAQGNAINADTVMRMNEYMWESQQITNKRYWDRMARQNQQRVESAAQVQERLRSAPEAADVRRGDALNVILNDLTAPGVYAQSVSMASKPVPSSLIKNIPFQFAPQAITISLDELTDSPPAGLLDDPRLATERAAVATLADQLRDELDKNEKISPESLQQFEAATLALRNKFQATFPQGTPNRRPADNYVKALYGLSRMLQTPDVKSFLTELDSRPDAPLGNLIAFMQSFNLRFGAATTPEQGQAYTQLFPVLRELRDQVNPAASPLASLTPEQKVQAAHKATDFFSGVELNEPGAPTPPAPAPPAPQPQP